MSIEPLFRTSQYTFRLLGEMGTFQATFASRQVKDGVEIVTLRLTSPTPAVPKELRLEWRHPVVDIHAMWNPGVGTARGLVPDWAAGFRSQATSQAPVVCLHNLEGHNRLTFAASDALHAIENRCGVHEESAEFVCGLRLFLSPMPPVTEYTLDVRLDTRDVYYHQVLKDVADWWASLPGYTPAPVPDVARLPMYATWYSMHQNLVPEEVEKQCRIAKELGCEAVIEDDGWETTDSSRGFGYAGDWKPLRIPQMKEHVQRVHDLGMKFVLWYSVAHAGYFSETYKRFQDKMLFDFPPHNAGILDPRFPEVREHLIHVFERGIREWDLDGFKLDFVDMFTSPGNQQTPADSIPGRDYAGVPEAVDRLMTDVMARLRAIKPDVMIEFRQSYIGPLMRKYGNMFRAGDCPNAATTNRRAVIDVRLLCGNTAAHTDPIMWNPAEPVESAALQMIHPLFGVPQVSMLLDKLPADHFAMVKFWLTFWRENRDVLLDGELHPMYPHAMYPVVTARNTKKMVVAVYEPWVVRLGQQSVPDELLIVNGTQGDTVVVDLAKPIGKRRVQVFDCQGRQVVSEITRFEEGLYMMPVPPAGLIRCTKQ